LFSPQFATGFEIGCKLGNAIYPLDCASIAPVQTDAIFNCGAIASPTI
jgi:hypothetical protein